ncbi:MAG: cyclic nucleotide-binding domain-containing protein [Alphaproteobacteria bacterium]|nr:cyclic nucleotide-binding domain-containing protein [Alphaproteobacteria bacterium]
MAIDALVKPMLPLAIFTGLKPLQITEIARRAERIIYRPGETIIEEDTVGDAAVLIVAGDAVRISGPEYRGTPEPVSPGSLLGEMAMLVESVHSSTIIARGNVKALRITRAEMLEQMEEDPSLAEHFVERITGRLRSLAEDLRNADHAFARWSAGASLH